MRWQLDHITVRYRLPSGEAVAALDDLSFTVQSGDRVAVVGHNGSGKSTLARVLAGIITPTIGQVTISGDDVTADDRSFAYAALVLQNPDDNIIGETVREELELTLGPIRGRANDATIVQGLAQFGLSPLLDRRTSELSGGEIQLLALACGLMSGRQLVVLDEPTSHLDPPSRRELIEKLIHPTVLHPSLSGDLPTVVLITQYESEARRFPRVVQLAAGRVVYDGPSDRWPSRETSEVPSRDAHPTMASVAAPREDQIMQFAIPGPERRASVQVRAGERIGLVGRIGSGKTTLAYRLAGLLDDDTGGESPARDGTSGDTPVVLIQFPERQLFAETVGEDVAFGPHNQNSDFSQIDTIVRQSMDGVGLAYDQFAQRSPFSLSGGQKHRAAMAGVTACRTSLFFLDEPTSALDPAGIAAVEGILATWSAQGISYVVISHDIDWLQTVTRRVWVLHDGMLMADADWDSPQCRDALLTIGFRDIPSGTVS